MSTPLILQIQQAAPDSKSSVTDALRRAKIACVKLELTEFGNWVDLELNGYMDKKVEETPPLNARARMVGNHPTRRRSQLVDALPAPATRSRSTEMVGFQSGTTAAISSFGGPLRTTGAARSANAKTSSR